MGPLGVGVATGLASGVVPTIGQAIFGGNKGGAKTPEAKSNMPAPAIQPLAKTPTATSMPTGSNIPMPTNQSYAQALLNR